MSSALREPASPSQPSVAPHIAQQQLGHSRLGTTQRNYLRLPTHDTLREFGAAFG